MDLDERVLGWMLDVRTPWLTDVFLVVTNLGGTVASWAIAAAVTVALLVRRRPALAVMVSGAMLTGLLAMSGLKLVVGRARPPFPERLVDETTHSFPSGHAMMSAILVCVVAVVIVRVADRRWRTPWVFVLLAAWTLTIGLSRVYLAAHWLTDVLAGWALGALWAALWAWGLVRFDRKPSGATPSSLP
ncbi:phosphatase PAP2 family protein [Rhodococcus kronopolitis]|uniref:Phosphatase PAP2 family protein n=1 Tax=Rhodococcus kronopolitis TaxID=1460226 RepID=A0ABV9FNP5_9NOCA